MIGMLVALMLAAEPWSPEASAGVREVCENWNAGRLGAGRFCACIVRTLNENVEESEILAFMQPEPAPTDAHVTEEIERAIDPCTDEARAGVLDL